jgi:hypothetical protein
VFSVRGSTKTERNKIIFRRNFFKKGGQKNGISKTLDLFFIKKLIGKRGFSKQNQKARHRKSGNRCLQNDAQNQQNWLGFHFFNQKKPFQEFPEKAS